MCDVHTYHALHVILNNVNVSRVLHYVKMSRTQSEPIWPINHIQFMSEEPMNLGNNNSKVTGFTVST